MQIQQSGQRIDNIVAAYLGFYYLLLEMKCEMFEKSN